LSLKRKKKITSLLFIEVLLLHIMLLDNMFCMLPQWGKKKYAKANKNNRVLWS